MSPKTSTNPMRMREMNRELIIDFIKRNEPISRATISKTLDFSKSTISLIIQELIDIGLIEEIGNGKSHRGKKPILLQLTKIGVFAIGIDISNHNEMQICISNYRGDILAVKLYNYDMNEDFFRHQLSKEIQALITDNNLSINNLCGIGMAFSGIVDTRENAIKYSINFTVPPIDFKIILSEAFHVPILLQNESNLGVIAEHDTLQKENYQNIIFLSIKEGIGSGIILNNHLYTGTNDGAGEIGHMTIDKEGPKCKCGSKGCLETYASEISIVNKAMLAIARGENTILSDFIQFKNPMAPLSVQSVIQSVKSGDNTALEIIREACHALGIGIATLINLFNPEIIVLYGRILELEQIVMEELHTTIQQYALSSNHHCKIVKASMGSSIISKGAALYALNNTISNYVHKKTALKSE